MKPNFLLRGVLCALFSPSRCSAVGARRDGEPAYAQDDDNDSDQDRHESKGRAISSIEVLSGRPDMIAAGIRSSRSE